MSKVEGRGPIDPPPPSLMPSCNFFTLCLLGLKKMLPNQPMILLTLKPFRPPLRFHTCIHCNFFVCFCSFLSWGGGGIVFTLYGTNVLPEKKPSSKSFMKLHPGFPYPHWWYLKIFQKFSKTFKRFMNGDWPWSKFLIGGTGLSRRMNGQIGVWGDVPPEKFEI